LRSAPAVSRADWLAEQAAPVGGLHDATAAQLAATWLKDALEEHASVAAFARFTMHLLSVGAPPDLVADAQRASIDEIRHATMCFALARRYGSSVRGPGALSLRDAMGEASLIDIAALTAEEGCVGETLGAVLAREQLAVARDAEAVRVLRKIARDEARHAELSWRFVRWAILQGGDEVRRAVAERIEAAISATLAMEIQSYAGIDLDAWHAHGRLTCSEARAVAELAVREVVRPCLQAATQMTSRSSSASTAQLAGV
jgi:hypothetical protein